MTAVQMGLTIAVCTAATMLTRFLPFVVFSSKDQQPPEVVRYLGRVLPAAIFGMLIVYCLKSVISNYRLICKEINYAISSHADKRIGNCSTDNLNCSTYKSFFYSLVHS